MLSKQSKTTKESAVQFGASVGRARHLVLAGELPAERFGRNLMIKVSDLAGVKPPAKPVKKRAEKRATTKARRR